jgi:hypothetical protein
MHKNIARKLHARPRCLIMGEKLSSSSMPRGVLRTLGQAPLQDQLDQVSISRILRYWSHVRYLHAFHWPPKSHRELQLPNDPVSNGNEIEQIYEDTIGSPHKNQHSGPKDPKRHNVTIFFRDLTSTASPTLAAPTEQPHK